MKKFILYLLFCFTSINFVSAQGGVIILEGNYQGKNLYVQNPFGSGGVGFCVTEVKVNGNITTDETQSSAFEIDMKPHSLNIGDKVEIKIYHKEDCKPKVLNPEVLKPKSTYEVIAMTADKDGNIKWTTKSETGKLAFAVEQFRWNKWVKVGEVDGMGTPTSNDYSFKVVPHSGNNQVRVRQTDYSGQPRLSKPVAYASEVPEIDYAPIKASKDITFFQKGKSDKQIETMYEIYDQYGNIVKKGFGSKLDVSNLPKGAYFLNYDNKMGEFVKK
ncbi:T9SS type A sorting domain-containing protein [Sediminibacterium sp.]|uniref:T9SS type A sorting domain-containing protein n=1 Tax=Sediminibacterium sp. TaxID=1917865 RepID=UPI0027239002|nr:T9SS type A sorting domain-containing protein [Sediminibacterium sp.]MDO9000613.1 T9SS type A sorting domain-containing protein [Bacteroidota bacterium]MDP3146819.1 T9SS type A sorting domain-containing protein [Bacteroidota bacterium]MDP3567635.1 T9SS type A sorting domain-containing protein [Sediminibacterium sp.]